MKFYSPGIKLYRHTIETPRVWGAPIDNKEDPSGNAVTPTVTLSQTVLDQVKCRFHHLAVAVAHIPVALIDTVAAVALSLTSFSFAAVNMLTLNYFSNLVHISNCINSLTKQFWVGSTVAVPAVSRHLLSAINPHAKVKEKFFDAPLLSEIGISDSLTDHTFGRVMAIAGIVIVTISAPIFAILGVLSSAISLLSLGTSKPVNSFAYLCLNTTFRLPLNIYFYVLKIINPHLKFTDTRPSQQTVDVPNVQSKRSESAPSAQNGQPASSESAPSGSEQ